LTDEDNDKTWNTISDVIKPFLNLTKLDEKKQEDAMKLLRALFMIAIFFLPIAGDISSMGG